MIQIPNAQNHQYTQPNTSDVLGDIFISKNLDLTDNLGKLRIGKRLILNGSSTDAGLNIALGDCPVAIKEFNTSSGNVIISTQNGRFVQTSTDYPAGTVVAFPGASPVDGSSNNSDLCIYKGDLYYTGDTGLYKLGFGTTNWGSDLSGGNTLASSNTHMMEQYNGKLYITDLGNKVSTWDGSAFVAGVLTITAATNNVITSIRASSNRVWITTVSTINGAGGRGYVYEWDGTSATPTKEHKLDSAGAIAMVIKDDIPYVMDVYGKLLSWNGGTFKEVARLNRRLNRLFYNSNGIANNRYIHPNGMHMVNGRINIVIDGRHYDSTGTIEETIPSGVWEYDETIGLYHKHSFGLSHAADTIIDYGSNRISRAGAITEVNYPDNSSNRNGTFMAGCDFYSDATTIAHGIFYDDSNDTLQKAGYMVTKKIEATDGSIYNFPTIESGWDSLFTLYKKLGTATDKIIPKYRTSVSDSVEAPINWLDGYNFQVANSAVNIANYYNVLGNNGEVEIMQGIGAGMCTHITNAVLNGGNWTVTVDEKFIGVTGTSQARFQNWTKISEIIPNNMNYNSDTFGFKSQWVQLKIFMLFTSRDEIERLLISNSNATPVK